MANYSGFILSSRLFFTDYATLIVSGTITISGTPVKRNLVCYVYPNFGVPYITSSDASTGEFSIELPCGANTRLVIIAFGEKSTEETKIFDWVARP